MKGALEPSQTVCFFLPGPEADSTSSRQQQLQQALPLGIEMKFASVTCTRVPKAARGLCGEKCPEVWAVTSNPGPVDMTFTQSLEVTSNPGLTMANREEQGSLGPSSTAFDCRAVWELGMVLQCPGHQKHSPTEDIFYKDRSPRATQPQVGPTGTISR